MPRSKRKLVMGDLHVTVLHAAVRGRVRVRAPALKGNLELVRELERRLNAVPGLSRARASEVTGSLVLCFDEGWSVGGVTAHVQVTLGSAVSGEPSDRPEREWHALDAADVLAALEVDREVGVLPEQVTQRRARLGGNALRALKARSELAILGEQLKSVPVALLLGSAALSVLTGGLIDAAAILTVVAANAAIGFATERGAERTIESLGAMVPEAARVRRASELVAVPVEEIVPGDILLLSPGMLVPADARVLRTDSLMLDESTLTGESTPVAKSALPGDPEADLGERRSMVYRGTLVLAGSGECVVVATGTATELGRIQTALGSVEVPETPLQRELRELGFHLALGAAALCGVVFGVGLLRGRSVVEMLKTAISLGVAAVPEGLPTVATSTLALGIRRLRAVHVAVRKLSAVETMGCIQVMCLDKTGTITEKNMAVRGLLTGRGARRVGPREALGELALEPDVERLLLLGALCSEAEIEEAPSGASVLRGSSTESALVSFALDCGIDVRKARSCHPRCRIHERTQVRRYMATVHSLPESSGRLLAVKGSPLEVLALCDRVLVLDESRALDEAERARVETENERMAADGLRVLGFAYADLPKEEGAELDAEDPPLLGKWTWVGLIGIADPPRETAKASLHRLHEAGIETIMITGDQSGTALAIGKEVEMNDGAPFDVLDAEDLQQMTPERVAQRVKDVRAFARVNPAHKLGIVRALQGATRVVAMTGDGVNDGLALRAADVGVAMASGSPLAREVADIVLEDDSVENMILAVEQGRAVHADIKKAVHFVLATNLSEILLTFAQVAFTRGKTLTPTQLLFINVLTDVLPGLALGADPPDDDVLSRPPRARGTPMFARSDLARIAVEGALIAASALGADARRANREPSEPSLSFAVLTAAQLLFALSARSERRSLFAARSGPSNQYVPMTVALSLLVELLSNWIPAVRRALGMAKLEPRELGVTAFGAVVPVLSSEALKFALGRGFPFDLAPLEEDAERLERQRSTRG